MNDNRIYIVIDGDDVGSHIEHLILRSKFSELKSFSDNYKKAMQWLATRLQKDFKAEIVFEGGDSLLAICSPSNFDVSSLEKICGHYQIKAQRTISVGIGMSIVNAYIGLKLAKTGGKNRLIDLRELHNE